MIYPNPAQQIVEYKLPEQIDNSSNLKLYNSLGELVKHDTNSLIKFRNFGKKSLQEIEQLVEDKGLSFGMDVTKYMLDDE